ncbi:MAG: carbohydrate ABC transporter permease, partial [Rhodococcus fascians]
MKTARIYLGVVIILVWGLAPFYWMAVTAFRDPRYTFDTTPWPTHVTTENFSNALSTSNGNNFLRAVANSLIIGGVTTFIA